MISQGKTLGCFQIESPGQRELVGKSGLETFGDIITDISLFRPGPVKSDMITPYLNAKQLADAALPPRRPAVDPGGDLRVVVFYEQVIEMIAQLTGCTLAEADEARRALGDVDGMAQTKLWFFPRTGRGYPHARSRRSGRCWRRSPRSASRPTPLRSRRRPTSRPGSRRTTRRTSWPGCSPTTWMYPKRLILDDARQLGITVLGLDVNASEKTYVVEAMGMYDALAETLTPFAPQGTTPAGSPGRARLRDLAGAVGGQGASARRRWTGSAARPYHSLTDFWHRARVSRPVVERLVLAGGFDGVYGIGSSPPGRRRGKVTRRDLLLQVADLDRHTRAVDRALARPGDAGWAVPGRRLPLRPPGRDAAARNSSDPLVREAAREEAQSHGGATTAHGGGRATRRPGCDGPAAAPARDGVGAGVPPVQGHPPGPGHLRAAGPRPRRHPGRRGGQRAAGDERLRAGPRRAGDPRPRREPARRGLLLGLPRRDRDPGGRPAHLAQPLRGAGGRGQGGHPDPADPVRAPGSSSSPSTTAPVPRTRPLRGRPGAPTPPRCSTPGCSSSGGAAPHRTARHSLRATALGAPALHEMWRQGGPTGWRRCGSSWRRCPRASGHGRGGAGSGREPGHPPGDGADPAGGRRAGSTRAGGMGRRRVLVHSSGPMSPYADIKPAGEDAKSAPRSAPRKLWHSSPGSSGG